MLFPPCYEISGTGPSRTCTYIFTNGLVFCGTNYASGSCPSAGLYGCCVTSGYAPGGYTDVNADCYYDAATGEPARAACTPEDAGSPLGPTRSWQTTSPGP
jgi:hypothetical protein